nr:hypothetical protein [Parachlamydiaceae bacterium]
MSLDHIRNFSFSNITDAFNNSVDFVKQQSTPVQGGIIVGVALAALALVTGTFMLIKRIFFGATVVHVGDDKVAEAMKLSVEAQKVREEAQTVNAVAQSRLQSAQALADSVPLNAFQEEQKIAAKIRLKVLEPVGKITKDAADSIVSLESVVSAQHAELISAQKTLSNEAISSSDRVAAQTKLNIAVAVITSKTAEITRIYNQAKTDRLNEEGDVVALEVAAKKSLAEQTSVWTPLNAAKATVALGATGVGAAIAGGLMAPVLLPAFLTAQVAAGIGAVGSALY